MRNSPLFLLIVFVLAIATAYAFSQEQPKATDATLSTSTSNDHSSSVDSNASDPLAIVPAAQVQSEIENAVRRDAGLNAEHVAIRVNDDTIELSGTVNSGKEKVAIYRLAESFAMNRRVKDLVTVGNRSTSQANSAPPATQKQM